MRPSQPVITKPAGKPVLALLLGGGAALLLLLATLSHAWLQSGMIDFDLGLRSGQACVGDSCRSYTTREVVTDAERALASDANNACIETHLAGCDGSPDVQVCHDQAMQACSAPASGRGSAFVATGWITSIATWLAVLGLLVAMVLLATGSTVNLPIAPTTIAFLSLVVAIIAGCVFVATKPGGTGAFGIGWAFWIFAAGAVGGLMAAMMFARALRPAVGDWDPGGEEPADAPGWDMLTPPPK